MGPAGEPQLPPRDGSAPTPQQFLASVPFYRRNGTATALLLVSLALGFGGPLLLAGVLERAGTLGSVAIGTLLGAPLFAVCLIVLAGNVYYGTFDAKGNPTKWGWGNKIVAALIVLGWI